MPRTVQKMLLVSIENQASETPRSQRDGYYPSTAWNSHSVTHPSSGAHGTTRITSWGMPIATAQPRAGGGASFVHLGSSGRRGLGLSRCRTLGTSPWLPHAIPAAMHRSKGSTGSCERGSRVPRSPLVSPGTGSGFSSAGTWICRSSSGLLAAGNTKSTRTQRTASGGVRARRGHTVFVNQS